MPRGRTMIARAATGSILAFVTASCGQFGGVHREASPAVAFTPSAVDRRLVGYIVKTSAVPASPGATAATVGRAVPIRIDLLALYQQAAASCPGLPWTILAAIGTVESDNGQSSAPGVHSGANSKGAEGPMQMLPASFAAFARPVPPGGAAPPSPYDFIDAAYAAARYLCATGALHARDLAGAVFAYNHAGWYVTEVLRLAARYAGSSA